MSEVSTRRRFVPWMGNFRDLVAWQRAHSFVLDVYRASSHFPRDERFGLTAQTRRAAVSVASNLAEGGGRDSDRELHRFVKIARGSLQEVICQILIAQDLGYLDADQAEALISSASLVGRLTAGLLRKTAR